MWARVPLSLRYARCVLVVPTITVGPSTFGARFVTAARAFLASVHPHRAGPSPNPVAMEAMFKSSRSIPRKTPVFSSNR